MTDDGLAKILKKKKKKSCNEWETLCTIFCVAKSGRYFADASIYHIHPPRTEGSETFFERA